MGTDLFKQGIDGGEGSLASTLPVVQDPTGSLSLSKTVTPEATGPKVSAIPEPDPELLALFAPQADGDFDPDGLGDRNGTTDKRLTTTADDWRSLLDDSIPVQSLAKEEPLPSPAMTAELRAVELVGVPAKTKRKKRPKQRRKEQTALAASDKSKNEKGKKKRIGLLATALTQPTTDASQSATFARSADAFSEGTIGASSADLAAETTTSSAPKADPATNADSASNASPTPVVRLAPFAEAAPTPTLNPEPEDDVALALAQTLGKSTPAKPVVAEPTVEPTIAKPTPAAPTIAAPTIAAPTGVGPAIGLTDNKPGGAGAILADKPDPTLEDRPVDAEVDAYQAVLNGVDAFRSRSRIIMLVAAVCCLVVIGVLLIAGESNDGGANTAADTEELAAQSERTAEEAEPATTATTRSTADRRAEDRTTTTIDDDVSFAALAQRASSTTERSVEDPNSTGSSTAEGTSGTDGTGDPGTTDGETATTNPSDASSTTEAPSTTATESTVCTGVTWNLVLDEGFDGSSLDTGVWAVGDGAGAGQAVQRPNAVSVESGSLNITAQMLDDTLVSGGVQHRSSQTYGRYEARVRADTDGVMNGLIQTAGSGSSHVIYDAGSVGDASNWTTMAVEWTPTSVKYYV
ncbi:MAG: hypothetical protein ACR2QO_03540, partial [Acidimicrobiales bacterium]